MADEREDVAPAVDGPSARGGDHGHRMPRVRLVFSATGQVYDWTDGGQGMPAGTSGELVAADVGGLC